MPALKVITRTPNTRVVKSTVARNILAGIPVVHHDSKIRKYTTAHADNPYVTADDVTYDA